MSNTYTKHVDYRFEVDNIGLAIKPLVHKGHQCLEIEETRKNGQEDCHMAGLLVKEDGEWKWDEGKSQFDFYMGEAFSSSITAFLNENPPPEQ